MSEVSDFMDNTINIADNYDLSKVGKSIRDRPLSLEDIEKRQYWRLRNNEEFYNGLFNQQKGCCAICGIHQSKLKHRLQVDHDHRTGKIRELLCICCNTGLGQFKHNQEILEKAKIYLNKHA